MTFLNKTKNLFGKLKEYVSYEKPTKKEILGFSAMAPIAMSLGIFIGMCITGEFRQFKKYNEKTLSEIDSLSIDTIIKRKGEIYADTLIDYYRLSKKEIKFKTSGDLDLEGSLFVKNKEFSKYKLLKNGIHSEEIFSHGNEVKVYFISENFFGRGFKINKLELTKSGTSAFLKDSFEVNLSNREDTFYKIYTRETDLGKKALDNERVNVTGYLNKIEKYKKSLKD